MYIRDKKERSEPIFFVIAIAFLWLIWTPNSLGTPGNSRSRDRFAGISLEATSLRPDNEADKRLYGKDFYATEIIQESKLAAPESAHDLMAALQEASPRLKS